MTDELDPYRILGVEHSASLLDIARARRRLAKIHHPDLAAGDAAAAEMGRINAAWTLLADPEARAAWDRANGIGSDRVGRPLRASTWTEWAYPPPAPRPATAAGSSGNAAWWVLGAFVIFLVVVVAGGIVSTLDRPAGPDPAPWVQENLGR